MNIIILGVMQFVYWSAFYALRSGIKDEAFILSAFVVTLVVSMVTAAIFLARRK